MPSSDDNESIDGASWAAVRAAAGAWNGAAPSKPLLVTNSKKEAKIFGVSLE